jgi:myo-inositol-1(or 4)-monophosphatase
LTAPGPGDLGALAALLREAAREELLPRFRAVERRVKADGSVLTEADRAMQVRIAEALARRWPAVPLLGEEMEEGAQRRLLRDSPQGLWCLDPLDGTSNFAAGVPFFAVSLALIDAAGPRLGLVLDPLRDEAFAACSGGGARLDGAPMPAAPQGPLQRAVVGVDFKRLPHGLARDLAAHPPYASQRNFGACALEWCWLASGRLQALLHGGQKLWDYAAGVLILEEAGGVARTLEGEPVFSAALAPRSVVAACDAVRFEAWAAVVGRAAVSG